jgi:DNA-binding NtrC family response regulator
MKAMKIFVIEDDEFYGKVLRHHISLNPDYEVELFANGTDAIKALRDKPDLITLDYSLPDMSGFEVLRRIKDQLPEVPVVIISGQEHVETAMTLLREGAHDYLTKNEHTKDLLWNIIRNLSEKLALQSELTHLKAEVKTKYKIGNLILGDSPVMQSVFRMIEKAAQTNITVSLTGETGTGKELAAKSIHFNSPRHGKAFVPVNLAAIPETLIESELFGHEKGAFTDAQSRRIGKFEEANGGTLFLDEIGEMPLHLQSKLLRVLQEREITRIGGNQEIKIDVRLVVATHRNLTEMVKEGKFREDLYYRLLGMPIEMPPLRDRTNDIIILAKHFLNEFARENKMATLHITTEAAEKILSYSFPGNVREQKAAMDLAAVLCNGTEVTAGDISFNSSNRMFNLLNEQKSMREFQITIIEHFLRKFNGDIERVAELLKIGKSTIYRMIQNKEVHSI